ncbi:MAG: transglutaminaseTgpA domain-containing protein, partial [Geobacteraceae bacterium]|nr:transglutaminaseTgpA domain-containing protein [Geobacteraceae bacterium]
SSSQVRELKNPVLRAQSPRLAREDLYWRGIVLNTPRNNAWVRSAVDEGDYVKTKGREVIQQTIFPEPNSGPYLITLDTPVKLNGIRVQQAADLVFTRKRHTGRVRYDTVSSLNRTITVRGEIDRDFYLKLPDRVSSRVKALGKRIASQGSSDRERLAAFEEYFSSARFRYTTRGLPHSGDPIAEFLFQGRSGHCELFATSFMILLREAGIPARLVGGYYGGDYNEIGGYYLVTEDMAHVWVEVYLKGIGWVRKDPSVFADNFTAGGDGTGASIIARVRKFSDSLNYYWNSAVISYDLEKQIHIFQSANSTLRNFSFPVGTRWLVLVMVAIGGLAAGYRVSVRRLASSPEKKLLRTFYRILAKKYPDVSVSSATGLMELADYSADPNVRDFAEIFYRSVYRDRPLSVSQMDRLQELLNAMENPSEKDAGAAITRHNSLT